MCPPRSTTDASSEGKGARLRTFGMQRTESPATRRSLASASEDSVALRRDTSPTSVVDAATRQRLLAVFDVDGTLLVSHGREIVTSPNGMRAAVHPLVEPCASVLPNGCQSDFAFSGEEDLNGDTFGLLQRACVIEPVADVLRRLVEDPSAEVAILTARGHDPSWLAHALSEKLQLARPLRPELVMTVYSAGFEKGMLANAGSLGRTADRKAYALGQMIAATSPSDVAFYDDMPANLDKASEYMVKAHPSLVYQPHAVPASASAAACAASNVDFKEIAHFQCRDEGGAPNALVEAMLQTELAVMYGLREYTRPSALPTSFLESSFRTKAEYEASLLLPADERAAAERVEAARVAAAAASSGSDPVCTPPEMRNATLPP